MSTRPYDALVADLDGTLLDDGGRVRPRVMEAVREAVERGVVVIVSTGRSELPTIPILEEIGLDFVTPDVAILQTRSEFTGLPPDAVWSSGPRQEFFAANVYVKRDGQWKRKAAFLLPITRPPPSG